jgi:hypothetical protein
MRYKDEQELVRLAVQVVRMAAFVHARTDQRDDWGNPHAATDLAIVPGSVIGALGRHLVDLGAIDEPDPDVIAP